MLGLAQASKVFKEVKFEGSEKFSKDGNEVAWGTIGNASTSEGLFFETINAAGVLQVPMVISVWDDEYGISVGAEYQTTKEDISEILKGFQRDDKGNGYDIFVVEAWDSSFRTIPLFISQLYNNYKYDDAFFILSLFIISLFFIMYLPSRFLNRNA